MFGRLLPRETSFYDFFEEHARLTVSGTDEFLSMVSSGANLDAKAKRIKEIEHETDVITHQCVEALHKTFITPIERDDIYRLISRMDDIMDFIEAASERIVLYELKTMTQEVKDLTDVLVRAAREVERAVHGLSDMSDADGIRKLCVEVNRLENATDRCEDVANIIEGVVLEHA